MLNCEFRSPNSPPSLPDFILMKFKQYASKGGTNILGFPGFENIVPIPCRKVLREGDGKKGKRSSSFRIGFPVEGYFSLTPYKTQGKTLERAKLNVKEFASVPGLFVVSISQQKLAKIPPFTFLEFRALEI